jgi:outer membrane protein OmpA-like peptidoglycan-associated protein
MELLKLRRPRLVPAERRQPPLSATNLRLDGVFLPAPCATRGRSCVPGENTVFWPLDTKVEKLIMSVWTTKLRGPALGLTLVTAFVAASPLQAAEPAKPSKQENIGVLSGFTIGAAAGGPFGAVIGAAGGALLGQRYHRQAEEKASLAANLSQSEAARGKLQGDLVQTQAHGEQLGQALDRTRNLEAAVGFRTGDDTLSSDDVARLQKLGSLAGVLSEVKVRVSGYADPRGSESLNAALSERRADAVAHVLAEAGVDPSRLVVEAHGERESKSAEGDLDGYAFERRVTVRIEQAGAGAAVALAGK